MKTPEDEAFDDLARRQGGGYRAKRAAAADKLQEPPSEWAGIKAILDEYGLQAIDFVADFKAALAQPAQEPVAWMCSAFDGEPCEQTNHDECGNPIPLYTAPPKREWVGLTDDEVYKIAFSLQGEHWRKIADAIEAKLKEKNT